jgi:hypothetical protein
MGGRRDSNHSHAQSSDPRTYRAHDHRNSVALTARMLGLTRPEKSLAFSSEGRYTDDEEINDPTPNVGYGSNHRHGQRVSYGGRTTQEKDEPTQGEVDSLRVSI